MFYAFELNRRGSPALKSIPCAPFLFFSSDKGFNLEIDLAPSDVSHVSSPGGLDALSEALPLTVFALAEVERRAGGPGATRKEKTRLNSEGF
jgi:hypothetical protein